MTIWQPRDLCILSYQSLNQLQPKEGENGSNFTFRYYIATSGSVRCFILEGGGGGQTPCVPLPLITTTELH